MRQQNCFGFIELNAHTAILLLKMSASQVLYAFFAHSTEKDWQISASSSTIASSLRCSRCCSCISAIKQIPILFCYEFAPGIASPKGAWPPLPQRPKKGGCRFCSTSATRATRWPRNRFHCRGSCDSQLCKDRGNSNNNLF